MNGQQATYTVSSPQTLNHRGIFAAAHQAHWQALSNAWKYPVYDLSGTVIAYRYKAIDSAAKPKYWWDGPSCTYYLLPGLREAIQKHNGLLYIASGEPDVLTFKSAGADNVLCWFGETSVPPDLLDFLNELGVSQVINYPDRDHTGHKAAEKIAAALHGSGIQFHAAALPDYLGDKGDINLLWQHVKFDRDAFWAALTDDTQALAFEPPKPAPPKRKPIYQDDGHQNYYAAIEQALDIAEYKGNGWSKKSVRCPFYPHEHDDRNPTAHWHRDKHVLHCFKCGETYLAKQVGAALGIEWKDFITRPDNLARPTQDVPDSDYYHFPQGIPDILREALLKLHLGTSIKDHAPALIVLELRQHAIHEQHIAPQDALTADWFIDYAAQINWNTSPGVIRRGLKQLVALGFLEIGQVQSAGRGRPTDQYHPQPLSNALQRLREVLRFRTRERIFSDQTPDTITPDWFADYPPEVARQLAELENLRRQNLFEEHEAAYQSAEEKYEREAEKIDRRLSPEKLLLSPSTLLVTDMPCKDSRDYRVLYYRSQVVTAGEAGRTIARAKVSAKLGVSDKTLSVLRARAGIVAEAQFETIQITEAEHVLATINKKFPWAAARDFGKFLDNGSGSKKGLAGRPEDIDNWVKNELARGHTITVYIQIASRERLATEQEQSIKTRQLEEKRQRQRTQSRPPSAGDRQPNLLDELLAKAIEEASPPTFTVTYMLRQIAMTPFDSEEELLSYADLFPVLRPSSVAYRDKRRRRPNPP